MVNVAEECSFWISHEEILINVCLVNWSSRKDDASYLVKKLTQFIR